MNIIMPVDVSKMSSAALAWLSAESARRGMTCDELLMKICEESSHKKDEVPSRASDSMKKVS